VKILTFRECDESSAGKTNVDSEKLNSRAIVCICSDVNPRASGSTASWFPPNGLSVNTSVM
jgi:hypothetical protein